jgi:hypothetical protein
MLVNTPSAQNWVSDIPAPILEALLKYERYANYSAYSIMVIASHSKYLTELLVESPLIIWMITRIAIQKNWTPEQVISLSTDKRTNILKKLGFSASKATFKNLQKLKVQCVNEALFQKLICIDWHTINPSLNHLNVIDLKLIYFLQEHPEYIKSSLLNSFNGWNWANFNHYLRDTEKLLRRANCIRHYHLPATQQPKIIPSNTIKRCRSLKELIQLHDKLTEEVNDFENTQAEKIIFPEPPLPASENIQPITNLSELRLEGRSQKHCILLYQDRIMSNEYYAYRVIQPERATLGIKRTAKGQWIPDQLRLSCNRTPSKETQKFVSEWLLKCTSQDVDKAHQTTP